MGFDGALSYFVAKNTQAPNTVISEDSGFAIKGWTAVRFENIAVIPYESSATAMGNYFFTDATGSDTKVEYSFGYFLDSSGSLRINLHHSSFPFDPSGNRSDFPNQISGQPRPQKYDAIIVNSQTTEAITVSSANKAGN